MKKVKTVVSNSDWEVLKEEELYDEDGHRRTYINDEQEVNFVEFYNTGALLLQQGRYQKALNEADFIMHFDSKTMPCVQGRMIKAAALSHLGRHTDALSVFKRAFDLCQLDDHRFLLTLLRIQTYTEIKDYRKVAQGYSALYKMNLLPVIKSNYIKLLSNGLVTEDVHFHLLAQRAKYLYLSGQHNAAACDYYTMYKMRISAESMRLTFGLQPTIDPVAHILVEAADAFAYATKRRSSTEENIVIQVCGAASGIAVTLVQHVKFLALKATAQKNLGESTEALTTYGLVFEFNELFQPKMRVRMHSGRAEVYGQLEEYQYALEDYNVALAEFEETNDDQHYGGCPPRELFRQRSRVKQHLELFESALDDYRRAFELQPSLEIEHQIGLVLYLTEKYAAAITYLKHVYNEEKLPYTDQLLLTECYTKLEIPQWQAAAKVLRALISETSDEMDETVRVLARIKLAKISLSCAGIKNLAAGLRALQPILHLETECQKTVLELHSELKSTLAQQKAEIVAQEESPEVLRGRVFALAKKRRWDISSLGVALQEAQERVLHPDVRLDIVAAVFEYYKATDETPEKKVLKNIGRQAIALEARCDAQLERHHMVANLWACAHIVGGRVDLSLQYLLQLFSQTKFRRHLPTIMQAANLVQCQDLLALLAFYQGNYDASIKLIADVSRKASSRVLSAVLLLLKVVIQERRGVKDTAAVIIADRSLRQLILEGGAESLYQFVTGLTIAHGLRKTRWTVLLEKAFIRSLQDGLIEHGKDFFACVLAHRCKAILSVTKIICEQALQVGLQSESDDRRVATFIHDYHELSLAVDDGVLFPVVTFVEKLCRLAVQKKCFQTFHEVIEAEWPFESIVDQDFFDLVNRTSCAAGSRGKREHIIKVLRRILTAGQPEPEPEPESAIEEGPSLEGVKFKPQRAAIPLPKSVLRRRRRVARRGRIKRVNDTFGPLPDDCTLKLDSSSLSARKSYPERQKNVSTQQVYKANPGREFLCLSESITLDAENFSEDEIVVSRSEFLSPSPEIIDPLVRKMFSLPLLLEQTPVVEPTIQQGSVVDSEDDCSVETTDPLVKEIFAVTPVTEPDKVVEQETQVESDVVPSLVDSTKIIESSVQEAIPIVEEGIIEEQGTLDTSLVVVTAEADEEEGEVEGNSVIAKRSVLCRLRTETDGQKRYGANLHRALGFLCPYNGNKENLPSEWRKLYQEGPILTQLLSHDGKCLADLLVIYLESIIDASLDHTHRDLSHTEELLTNRAIYVLQRAKSIQQLVAMVLWHGQYWEGCPPDLVIHILLEEFCKHSDLHQVGWLFFRWAKATNNCYSMTAEIMGNFTPFESETYPKLCAQLQRETTRLAMREKLHTTLFRPKVKKEQSTAPEGGAQRRLSEI